MIRDPNARKLQNKGSVRAYRERQKNRDPEWVAKQSATRVRYNKERPARTMFCSAKRRAKSKDLPFLITEADIVIPEVCPILGIPLIRSDGLFTNNSPTLDRIVPDLGYVPGNIQVISFRANLLKNNATLEELRLLLAFLQSQ